MTNRTRTILAIIALSLIATSAYGMTDYEQRVLNVIEDERMDHVNAQHAKAFHIEPQRYDNVFVDLVRYFDSE